MLNYQQTSFLDSPELHRRNNCDSNSYICCLAMNLELQFKPLVFTFKNSEKTKNKTKSKNLKPKFSILINREEELIPQFHCFGLWFTVMRVWLAQLETNRSKYIVSITHTARRIGCCSTFLSTFCFKNLKFKLLSLK